MNILFTNSAKEYGGNERWLITAANALLEKGHNIFFAGRNDLLHEKLSDDIPKYIMPFKHEFDKKTSSQIIKLIKSNNIELLFPTKRKENYLLGSIGKKLNLPVVFRLGIFRPIRKIDLPQRYVYKNMSNKIIVNAKIIKDYLLDDKVAESEKIEVVYNGYKFDTLKGYIPLPNIAKDKFVFASAGRLAPQKGYDFLLKAVNILKEKSDKFVLLIAGDGPDKKEYEEFIQTNNISENVVLLGHIENVRSLFAQSNCVVIPSRAEGIPNTLMEAWSEKRAVIASNAAGIPEAVDNQKNGILVDLNEEQIASVMLKLLENPNLCDEYGIEGYNKLNSDFTMEKMIERLEQIFYSIVD